ncbi:MAG: N-acetyl-gamma-glutamyl-phosphate reductase [Bacillota bacterium]
MINISILGATGYTGVELVRLLAGHPQAKLVALTSQNYVGEPMADVYPSMIQFTDIICEEEDIDRVVEISDVIFVALPHGHAVPIAEKALSRGVRVIDLGADFRFRNGLTYEQWYGLRHNAPQLLPQAVYGLPEMHRSEIVGSRLVANPGCYPTSAILGLAPLLKAGLVEIDSLIIDSKSGVSGAGRKQAIESLFVECNENIHAYGVANHRHTPEIEQELSLLAGCQVNISFTPHLMPITRGILSTIYARRTRQITAGEIWEIYREFYAGETFVRLLPQGKWPHTRWVYGSNFCDLGCTVDERTGRIIIVSAIDNLVKGASGQAIQNMNLLFGLPEETGLMLPPMTP